MEKAQVVIMKMILRVSSMRFFAVQPLSTGTKKNVKSNVPPPIKRMCFNCGKENHLVKECPYERRETHGGQLILRKNKYVPKVFIKRAPQKALVITKHEDYESGGEEEDDDTPSLAPLFSAPNDNKISKLCASWPRKPR